MFGKESLLSVLRVSDRSGEGRGVKPLKGFTLIELLIVIAIILILIAIALPNFLEAQIRARVVKAKGEIRSLAIAMESYNIDFNAYPAETEGDWWGRGRGEAGHTWLTTPISYIQTVPEDPFAGTTQNGRRTFESGGVEFGGALPQCFPCMATWVIYSSGPSEEAEPGIRSADPHRTLGGSNVVTSYSATNGTKSYGTIHWYGGDSMWIGVNIPSLSNKTAYYQNRASLDVGLLVDGLFYLHRLPPQLN